MGAGQQAELPQAAPTQRAPVDLVVAGRARGIVMALVGPTDVWVPLTALRATDVRFPTVGSGTIAGIEYLSLRSLAPGMTYRFDESTLTLNIEVKDAGLIKGSQALDLGQHRPPASGARAEPSGFINYSITGTTDNSSQVGGFTEMGFGNEAGHATVTGSYDTSGVRRGLIAYSIDQEAYLRRETLGDEIGTSGSLGSSVLIGGIGVSRLFDLQPGFLRAPSPSLSGTVLLPTRADVYINGTLYRSVELQPGQFNINDLPVPAGANVTQVVLHDATGNTTDITTPYYSAPALLRKGVNEYDYHLGFVRSQPYGNADRYGPLAGLGFYRVGLTDAISVGATFEKGGGRTDGGPTVDLKLPLGSLSLAASASDAANVRGHAAMAAYSFSSNRLSFSAFGVTRSAGFSTLALAPTDDRQTVEMGESIAFTAARGVSFGLLHASTRYRDIPATDRVAATVTLRPVRRMGLQFALERDIGVALAPTLATSRSSGWTIGTTLTFEIGRSDMATVQTQMIDGHSSTNLEFFKQAPPGYGVGYDAQLSTGAEDSFSGTALYRSQFFDASSFVSSGNGGTSATATLSGGVGIFGRGVFFAEPIQSAYGLVRVEGLDNVPVLFNGVEQGTTGKRGSVIIPNLSPYTDNAISLNLDAATDVEPDAAQKPLDPRFDSGVSTVFEIHRVHVFIGTLVIQRDGKRFAPSYGAVTIVGPNGTVRSDLGSNGEFYFENLWPGAYRATAIYAHEGTCAFDLPVVDKAGLQVDLGSFTCIER